MENDLLTTEQTAELLRTTIPTLADWRFKRRGPSYIKLGRRVLYRKTDIDTFLENHKIDHLSKI